MTPYSMTNLQPEQGFLHHDMRANGETIQAHHELNQTLD